MELTTMSIQSQANFWLRNVNDYSGGHPLSGGLAALAELLKNIYADYQSFEVSTAESEMTKIGIMANDLENYHNLTETVDCLGVMGLVGVLGAEGETSFFEVEKAEFKKEFKTSPTLPFEMLSRYGFYFTYSKKGKEVAAYKLCDAFKVYSERGAQLIPAVKAMGELPQLVVTENYIGTKQIFRLADFDLILAGKSAAQGDVDLSGQVMLNTAGDKAELWGCIAKFWSAVCAKSEGKLAYRAFINPYVFPNWTVKFIIKKKTLATFTIKADSVYVTCPLSYEMAQEIVRTRDTQSELVRNSIGGFRCINCGRCTDKVNAAVYEGVELCTKGSVIFGGESPHMINGHINTQADAEAICSLIMDIAKSVFI